MEGVEDIPGSALHEGVPWGAWETFPEYLDFLDTRRYAMDVAAQLAHGSLRFQRHARARRPQRGRDRRRHRGDAPCARRGDRGGRGRVLDVAHDLPPLDRRRRGAGHLRQRRRAVRARAGHGRRRRRRVRGDHVVSRSGNLAQLGGERFSQDHELAHAGRHLPCDRAADHVHDGAARRRSRGVAHRPRLRGRAERGRRAPLPAGRVAARRHPRRARRLPPVHAAAVVPAARRAPDRRAGPADARSGGEGAHPRRARRRARRRRVDGDVRRGDAERRRLPVRARRDRRLRARPRAGRSARSARRAACRRSRRSTTSSPRATAPNIVEPRRAPATWTATSTRSAR